MAERGDARLKSAHKHALLQKYLLCKEKYRSQSARDLVKVPDSKLKRQKKVVSSDRGRGVAAASTV